MATITTTGGDGIKTRSSSIVPPTQKARRPYLSLKQSMSAFFSEHVRFIKDQARGPESAFEKPYLDYEYPTMHLSIPAPDWGGGSSTWWYRPGDWVPGKDPNGGARPVPGCPGCALYADPPLDCNHPVEIHSGIWCTNTPGAQTEGVTTKKVAVFNNQGALNPQLVNLAGSDAIVDAVPDGVVAGDTRLKVYAKKGAIKNITVGTWGSLGPSAAVFVDSTVDSHTICGEMIDGAGSICHACIDVNCACDCSSITPMTLDDANTDDTIVAGGTATITVLDGCGPFTWSVSGAGYVLDSLHTESRSNKITCLPGACLTNYAAYVTVTIVDDCATSVATEIRNTAGKWGGYPVDPKYDYTVWCSNGVAPGEANCGSDQATCNARTPASYTVIKGKRRWVESAYICGYCLTDNFVWKETTTNIIATTDLPFTFPDPDTTKADYSCYNNNTHCFCIISSAAPNTWYCS